LKCSTKLLQGTVVDAYDGHKEWGKVAVMSLHVNFLVLDLSLHVSFLVLDPKGVGRVSFCWQDCKPGEISPGANSFSTGIHFLDVVGMPNHSTKGSCTYNPGASNDNPAQANPNSTIADSQTMSLSPGTTIPWLTGILLVIYSFFKQIYSLNICPLRIVSELNPDCSICMDWLNVPGVLQIPRFCFAENWVWGFFKAI
jgi:hypothetical protein